MDHEYEEVKSSVVSSSRPSEDHSFASAPVRKVVSSATREENERVALEQAKSAKYAFASAVSDGIQDQSQLRQETRDGLKVFETK